MSITFEWRCGYMGESSYRIHGGPDNGREARVLWFRPQYLRSCYREGRPERSWNGTRRDWVGERLGASGLLRGADSWIPLAPETVAAFHAQYDKDDDGEPNGFSAGYYRVNHRARSIRAGVYDLARKRFVRA